MERYDRLVLNVEKFDTIGIQYIERTTMLIYGN